MGVHYKPPNGAEPSGVEAIFLMAQECVAVLQEKLKLQDAEHEVLAKRVRDHETLKALINSADSLLVEQQRLKEDKEKELAVHKDRILQLEQVLVTISKKESEWNDKGHSDAEQIKRLQQDRVTLQEQFEATVQRVKLLERQQNEFVRFKEDADKCEGLKKSLQVCTSPSPFTLPACFI